MVRTSRSASTTRSRSPRSEEDHCDRHIPENFRPRPRSTMQASHPAASSKTYPPSVSPHRSGAQSSSGLPTRTITTRCMAHITPKRQRLYLLLNPPQQVLSHRLPVSYTTKSSDSESGNNRPHDIFRPPSYIHDTFPPRYPSQIVCMET